MKSLQKNKRKNHEDVSSLELVGSWVICTALPQPTPQNRQRWGEVASFGLIWVFWDGESLGEAVASHTCSSCDGESRRGFYYPVFLQKVFRSVCGVP